MNFKNSQKQKEEILFSNNECKKYVHREKTIISKSFELSSGSKNIMTCRNHRDSLIARLIPMFAKLNRL